MASVVANNSNPEMTTIVAAPSDVAASSLVAAPSSLGHHMHKNYLQEFTQKSGLPLPSYSIFNEGEPHVPRFRAIVLVDGMSITSPNTFSHRKEAEQDVAKLALECISVKFRNEGSHYIHQDPVFCKLILNEYAVKLKIDKPTYNTTQHMEILPKFITTVTFDGETYVGFTGKSKKEAEQNAARAVIDSILANSNKGNAMAQIIKTKGRLYAEVDNGVNVGSASGRNGIESAGANDVNRRLKLEVVSTNGSLPVGSANLVSYTSSWVDVTKNNQVNCQIPSLGFPAGGVESQAIILKERNKRSKQQQEGEQSKRVRVDEH